MTSSLNTVVSSVPIYYNKGLTTYSLLPQVRVHAGLGSVVSENELSLLYVIEGKAGITTQLGSGSYTEFYNQGQLQPINKDQTLEYKNYALCLEIGVSTDKLRCWQEQGKYDPEFKESLLTEKRFSNADNRRTIVDVTPRIKVFYIADQAGLRLGNHYHRHTEEFYFTVRGKLDWKLEDVHFISAMEGDQEYGEEELRTLCLGRSKQTHSVEAGQMIYVPTHTAHVVQPVPKTIFVGILGQDFDPKDMPGYKFQ